MKTLISHLKCKVSKLKLAAASPPSFLFFFWQKFYFIFSRAGPAYGRPPPLLHRVWGKFLPLFAIFSCVFSWKSGVFSAAVRQSHSNKVLRYAIFILSIFLLVVRVGIVIITAKPYILHDFARFIQLSQLNKSCKIIFSRNFQNKIACCKWALVKKNKERRHPLLW